MPTVTLLAPPGVVQVGARGVLDRSRSGVEGELELREVQPKGGRQMSYAEFLRGG